MFSATMTGQIQRIIYDNKKDKGDAMVKIVLAVSKQYSTDAATSKVFPLITIWGHDAAYLRNYAGKGQVITIINADVEYFKNDKKLDEDGNPIEQVSFKAGKVSFPKADVMKALVAAGVAEDADGADDDDDEDEKPRRKKRGSREKSAPKSRSSRRSRDEEDDYDDEDEDEEEEAPRRKKKAPASKAAPKKKAPKKKAPVDDDEDYDDDYDDDDDDYFDED